MFQGFPEETIRFFLDLRFHNDVTWFHAHRQEYEDYVRTPFREFIGAMAPVMQSVSPDMEVQPNRCLARINRDIRYTRDKSPYRDHLWLLFRRAAEPRETSVMYWFELGPENMSWGLGFWGLNRPAMDALRKRMTEKPKEVQKVLRLCGIPGEKFAIGGERYRSMKPPSTLPVELALLYPCKEIYVQRRDVPFSLCYQPELIDRVSQDFLELAPMYHLLRRAADEGIAAPDK